MTMPFYSGSTVGYLRAKPYVPGRTRTGLDMLDDIVELFLIPRQCPQQGVIVSDNIEA